MGLQCRRLNSLALPLYLNRHGITDPANNLHVNIPTFDTVILKGLRCSFHITHTENLSCNFTNCPSLVKLLEKVLDFSYFISRLEYVHHVTLTFARHANPLRNNLLQYWCTIFGRLLTTLVLKGCISLSIVGGDMFLKTFKVRPPQSPSHPLTLFRRAIEFVKPSFSPKQPAQTGWEFIPHRPGEVHSLPLFPIQGSIHSRLTTITLRKSPLPLLPPYAQWTFSALMASPITSLSLLEMVISTPGVWLAILPLLTKSLPKLKHLAILRCNILPQSDVYHPLQHFPHLHTFLYDGICFPPPPTLTLPSLSNLTRIYARSDMLVNLLLMPNTNFSNLKIIGTHIHSISRGFNLAEGADAISNLVNALRKHFPASAFALREDSEHEQIELPFKILLNIRQHSHMSYLLEQELSILPFLSAHSPSSPHSDSDFDGQPPTAALTTTRVTTRTNTTSRFRLPFALPYSTSTSTINPPFGNLPPLSSSTTPTGPGIPATTQKLMSNLKSFQFISGVSFDTFRPDIARDGDWDVLVRWLRLFSRLEEVRVGRVGGVFGWVDEACVGGAGELGVQNAGLTGNDGPSDGGKELKGSLNDDLVHPLRSPSQQSVSTPFQIEINARLPRPLPGPSESHPNRLCCRSSTMTSISSDSTSGSTTSSSNSSLSFGPAIIVPNSIASTSATPYTHPNVVQSSPVWGLWTAPRGGVGDAVVDGKDDEKEEKEKWVGVKRMFREGCPTVKRVVISGEVFELK